MTERLLAYFGARECLCLTSASLMCHFYLDLCNYVVMQDVHEEIRKRMYGFWIPAILLVC